MKDKVKKFWGENKEKLIFGVKCVAVGFGIGLIKGIVAGGKAYSYGGYAMLSSKLDEIATKLPDCDPVIFLKSVKNDDLLLNELRDRMYNEITVCADDVGKGVVDVMQDLKYIPQHFVLDNH